MSAILVGIGELAPQRTTPGHTALGLIGEACRQALADAGLHPSMIDGLFVGPHVGTTPQHVPATVAEYLGLRPTVASLVDLGGASAVGMLWRAAAAIDAGMCSVALCVLGHSRAPKETVRYPSRDPIREFDVPVGASGANIAYALSASAHMDVYGTTAEQLAWVAVAERANAQKNPDAVFYGKPLSVSEVLESPVISAPIHRDEAVMPCGGAAAVIVCSDNLSSAVRSPKVRLLGAAEFVTHRASSHNPSFVAGPLETAAARAFARAGISVADVDMWSLYDCYTIMVTMSVEDLGLCEKGEGGPFLYERDFGPRSKVPINTHGGQLGCGQADLAGGMGHIVEAVRQLRGEAEGRQVADCEVALITGNGATMSEAAVAILGRKP